MKIHSQGVTMSRDKPVLFHGTFDSFNEDWVSLAVKECVEELYKKGYRKIKVIVHDPIPGDEKTSTVYATTVIATMDDVRIDIGFKTPPL